MFDGFAENTQTTYLTTDTSDDITGRTTESKRSTETDTNTTGLPPIVVCILLL